jgi:hypothetical protein
MYKVELSNRTNIPIDESEINAVLNGVKNNQSISLKKGFIINPNHIIDIVLDTDRIKEVNEFNSLNAHAIREGMIKPKKLEPLKDDFQNIRSKLLK